MALDNAFNVNMATTTMIIPGLIRGQPGQTSSSPPQTSSPVIRSSSTIMGDYQGDTIIPQSLNASNTTSFTVLKKEAKQTIGQMSSETVTPRSLAKLAFTISESPYTDYYQQEVSKLEKMITRLDKFQIALGLVGDIARTVQLIAPAGAVVGIITKFLGYVKSIKTIKLEALGLVRSAVETTISMQECLVTIEFKLPVPMMECINNFYQVLKECTSSMSGIVERTSFFKEVLHRNKYRDMVKYMETRLGNARSDFTALTTALSMSDDGLSKHLGIDQMTVKEAMALRDVLESRRDPVTRKSTVSASTSSSDQYPITDTRSRSPNQSTTHQIFMVLGIKYDDSSLVGANGTPGEDDDSVDISIDENRVAGSLDSLTSLHKVAEDIVGLKNELFDRVLEILCRRIDDDLIQSSPDWEIAEMALIRERLLGDPDNINTSSQVWKGSYFGKDVRIKEIGRIGHSDEQASGTFWDCQRSYIKQIELMRAIETGPFLLKFIGAICPTGDIRQWGIVTEYMPHGDILTYLSSEVGSQADRVALTYQVAQGLVHLHRHDVLHGNLKPSNVLINHTGQAVIADFGYLPELEDTSTGRRGIPFIAPEVVNGEPCTELTDVFAFGKTAFQILTGVVPLEPHTWPQRAPYRYNRSWASYNTVTVYEFLSRCFADKPQHRFAMRQAMGIMEKIGMTSFGTTKDFTPYSMKIRLKWWETNMALQRAKDLPTMSEARQNEISSQINSFNYPNLEPSYVDHVFFPKAFETLLEALPTFRADGYTSYSLVGDTVKLYGLLHSVGDQIPLDSRPFWVPAYQDASRRLIDNIEILRAVSRCDAYVQLIFWEILHEVMWSARILTCLRQSELQNCLYNLTKKSSDQPKPFWDSLSVLRTERKMCDAILVEQLLRRGKDARACEILLSGRRPEDNLHLLGCVTSCENFTVKDPKPTGFVARLHGYPTWSSPVLTMISDLEDRDANGDRVILSRPPIIRQDESVLPITQREILALVRSEEYMAYHERLQDAWDICSAHIIEYESGFGGSQFPNLDSTALIAPIAFPTEIDRPNAFKVEDRGRSATNQIPQGARLPLPTTPIKKAGSPSPQSRLLKGRPIPRIEDLYSTSKLSEHSDTSQKQTSFINPWESLGARDSSTEGIGHKGYVPGVAAGTLSDDTGDEAQYGVPLP
ncbi:hypothetical protein I302_102741 [Kwoniella bestiolae CBS 10118]|uniref:Protein kinase domain-containing protein n=1 Tax=Kwoniella bestiolae CBS 10118 TaxID=1296100 RepID=A0AAJ8K4M0_9TREE